MPHGATLWLFDSKVRPVWEDPANQGLNAGKWIIPTESKEDSIGVMSACIRAISEDRLPGAHGAVMARKFGREMVMIWTHGEAELLSKGQIIDVLKHETFNDQSVKFKLHEAAKSKQIQRSDESDSDYETSPNLHGYGGPFCNPFRALDEVPSALVV